VFVLASLVLLVENTIFFTAEAHAAKEVFAGVAVVAIKKIIRIAAEICEAVAVADQAGGFVAKFGTVEEADVLAVGGFESVVEVRAVAGIVDIKTCIDIF